MKKHLFVVPVIALSALGFVGCASDSRDSYGSRDGYYNGTSSGMSGSRNSGVSGEAAGSEIDQSPRARSERRSGFGTGTGSGSTLGTGSQGTGATTGGTPSTTP